MDEIELDKKNRPRACGWFGPRDEDACGSFKGCVCVYVRRWAPRRLSILCVREEMDVSVHFFVLPLVGLMFPFLLSFDVRETMKHQQE